MSAVARLWRRAPAWRFTLVLAVLLSCMALLYAPWQPTLSRMPPQSHYPPTTPSIMLGSALHDMAIVAGRQIPLPTGAWHRVDMEIRRGDPEVDSAIFVQVQGNRVTGIVLARGSAAPSAAAHRLPYGRACESPHSYEARIVRASGTVRECWAILPVFMPEAWRRPHADPLFFHALDRLREAGMTLPPVLVSAVWHRVDETDWMLVEYDFDPAENATVSMQPARWQRDAVAAEPAESRLIGRVAHWTEGWTAFLEKGAAGALLPADLVADPAPNVAGTP